MPSVVLIDPQDDEVVVTSRIEYVQLVYGFGYRPKVGTTQSNYQALSDGSAPTDDPGRPVTVGELGDLVANDLIVRAAFALRSELAMRPVAAVRTTDNPLALNSTVQVADPQLKVPVLGGVLYRIDACLIYEGPTAADLSVGTTQPAGSTQEINVDGISSGASTAMAAVNRQPRTANGDVTIIGSSPTIRMIAFVRGYVTAGADGEWGLTFAQGVADPGQTTVFGRSRLVLTPIA